MTAMATAHLPHRGAFSGVVQSVLSPARPQLAHASLLRRWYTRAEVAQQSPPTMQTNWLTTGQVITSKKLAGGHPNGAPRRKMGA